MENFIAQTGGNKISEVTNGTAIAYSDREDKYYLLTINNEGLKYE